VVMKSQTSDYHHLKLKLLSYNTTLDLIKSIYVYLCVSVKSILIEGLSRSLILDTSGEMGLSPKRNSPTVKKLNLFDWRIILMKKVQCGKTS